MNISPLAEAVLEDQASVQELADLNELTHNEIYTRMLGSGLVLEHLPMGVDVSDFSSIDDWGYIHDAEHRRIANLLGISAPTDLSYFRFADQGQFNAWLEYHFEHHALIALALG